MSWRVQKGDCLSVMRTMDPSSVDHVIQDPPYDEKTHEGMIDANGKIQLGFDALSNMNHVREALRIAKRWVICFCSLEQLGEYKLFAGDRWVRAGIWEKTNPQPQKTGDRPAQGAEGIAIMYGGGGKKAWNGGGRAAIWRGPTGANDFHPNQKPDWLMSTLIREFTDYGETVLDGYCGSGSTGVSAVRMGRNFIGIEMLDKHLKTATSRLQGSHEQPELVFAKKRKPKQAKLFGGADVKEESEESPPVDPVEETRPLPGHLLGERGDETHTDREGETGDEGKPGGVVPELADRAREEGSEESDPFDGQEDDGQGLGEARAIGDPEELGGEDFPSEADPERNAGW